MKKIIISKENSKQRVDRFLVKELFSSGMTRGEIIRNVKSGNILVNKKTVKPSYILKESDEIKVNIKKEGKKPIPNKKVKLKIIYSDKNIIVINKSAGLQVHPSTSSGQARENDTLVNGLLAQFPEIKNVNDGSAGSEMRPGIVHRLDKDTSGVMIAARNQKSFDELKKLFQDRKVKKEYRAVVFGKLENKKGVIEKPIARAASYKKQTVASIRTRTKIRPAETEYKVLKEYANYSLVEARPRTGRTHQIRVHMAYIGHPIVGDGKYGLRNYKNPQNIKRQLLHADTLKFELFHKKYFFQAPLPADFSLFLQKLDECKIKS